jgi:hypothetical protein
MSEVDQFRQWAADMNRRAEERAKVADQIYAAQHAERDPIGCGKLIPLGTPVAGVYVRPSVKHEYFGVRALCNECPHPAADYTTVEVRGELRCGEWVDLSQKDGFVRGKEPPC